MSKIKVLYHGVSVYQILCAMVHRLAYHGQDEAAVMISEYYAPKPELQHFVENLKKFKIFDDVWIVPEAKFKKKRGKKLDEKSNLAQIEAVIKNICREFEKWGVDLSCFDKIYIASDNWSLGIYCLSHKIPYFYFEDACGMLTDLERYNEIIRENDMDNYIISKYLHGAGRSKLARKLYCNVEHQIGDINEKEIKDRIEDFSIHTILREKIPDKIPLILKIYDSKPYKMDEKKEVVLFLTQFVRSLARKDLNMQREMTALLLDYFSENAVVVFKEHPKDSFLNYHQFGEDTYKIERKLPSELLPFLFSRQLKAAITASSTSIWGLGDLAREYYSFSPHIESNYLYLHTAYGIAKIVENILKQVDVEIEIEMEEKIYLENFLKLFQIKNENRIHFCENNRREGKRKLVIFDNAKESFDIYLRYEKEKLKNIIAYDIEIKNEKAVFIPYQKEIFVYCEDEEVSKILRKLKFKKKLRFSHQIIEMRAKMTDEMALLEGRKKALECEIERKKLEKERLEQSDLDVRSNAPEKTGEEEMEEDEKIESFYFQRSFRHCKMQII